jgi:hypothetical protein
VGVAVLAYAAFRYGWLDAVDDVRSGLADPWQERTGTGDPERFVAWLHALDTVADAQRGPAQLERLCKGAAALAVGDACAADVDVAHDVAFGSVRVTVERTEDRVLRWSMTGTENVVRAVERAAPLPSAPR